MTDHHGSSDHDEMERLLKSARFVPDADFADTLRERLRARLGATPPETPTLWTRLRRGLRSRTPSQREDAGMNHRTRLITVVSFGTLAVMLALFVGLVLVRPGLPVAGSPPGQAQFGDTLTLKEYSITVEGNTWKVILFWEVASAPLQDYRLFLHARNADQVVAQLDETLETSAWTGEGPWATFHRLTFNADPPQAESLVMGLYDPATGARLPVLVDGQPQPDDQAVLPLVFTDHVEFATVQATVIAPEDAGHLTTEPGVEPTATPIPTASAQGFLMEELIRAIALSEDGEWLAVEAATQSPVLSFIYLYHRPTQTLMFIGEGTAPSLSADGRTLAFIRAASSDPEQTLMIYDAESGALREVAPTADPAQGMSVGQLQLSADGRYVVFTSAAPDVVNTSSQAALGDVYLYDRETETITRLAYDFGDASYFSSNPSLTADGGRVVFYQFFTDSPGTPPLPVMRYDRDTGEVAPLQDGIFPQVSANGGILAKLEGLGAPDYAEGWLNGTVTDLATGETRWLGRLLDQGPDGFWITQLFSLSADGLRIAFTSVLDDPRDPDLSPPAPAEGLGSAYSTQRAFVYDWATDSLIRADGPGADGYDPEVNSYNPVVSGDGRYLVFLMRRGDEFLGVFIRDLDAGTVERIALATGAP